MKKTLFLTIYFLLNGLFQLTIAQTPFTRGVNLTGWFQTTSPRQIQFSKYTKKDFENIKSMGCDGIRLPINLFYMAGSKPSYTIDPLFFEFLDQAVSWAEELHMYLLIDNHSSDDIASLNPDLELILSTVWAQMADHYKNRSSYILYEIMNEPHGLTTQVWGRIQQTAITAIRKVDVTHTIVVGPSNWNSYNDLSLLQVYADSNLLYTFHFYDPFIFTHQGATWPVPSMGSLAGVPFPYNSATMPTVPSDLAGTWVAGSIGNYRNDGTVTKVHALIDIAVAFKTIRNVNLYCGEFGVYNQNSNDADRIYWYSEMRNYLELKGIPWTTWDYQGGFGLFKKGSHEQFNYDLNIPLVQALGLIAPPQQVFVMTPDQVGFDMYTDYLGEKIMESSNPGGGTVDFYSTDDPNNGKYCLYWTGTAQYGTVGFNFNPDKDLSTLKSQNYALSLIVKGNSPGTKFDLRFIDTKTTIATDHPWRMNYTIDDSKVNWDNSWHKLYIPLSEFTEGGSWDNAWFNAIGAFDWKAVDRFDITAEYMSLYGKSVWFDNIRITNMDTVHILNTGFLEPTISRLSTLKVYPNPVKTFATISYTLTGNQYAEANIYNLSGQKVKTLVSSKQELGDYTEIWNMDNDKGLKVTNGIYFCRLVVADQIHIAKIVVLRN